MNAFEGIIDDLNTATLILIEENFRDMETICKKYRRYARRVCHVLRIYEETGEELDTGLQDWDVSDEDIEGIDDCFSMKENVNPETPLLSKPRSKRNAFKRATASIQEQVSGILNPKLNSSTTFQDFAQNVCIKVEKDIVKIEEMAAPTRPAPRARTRRRIKREPLEKSTSIIHLKSEQNEEVKNEIRDSGVMLPEPEDSFDTKNTRPKRSCVKALEEKLKRSSARPSRVNRASLEDNRNNTPVDGRPRVAKKINHNYAEQKEAENKLKSNDSKKCSVKKKIEKFEQITKQTMHSEERIKQLSKHVPRKTFTTKTRDAETARSKNMETETQKSSTKNKNTESAEICTPKLLKFQPKAVSTELKSKLANSTILSISRTEYRKQEKKRLEQEEKKRKREAIIQAKLLEKREKRLKMQKMRALDKPRFKVDEVLSKIAQQDEEARKVVETYKLKEEQRKQDIKEDKTCKTQVTKMARQDEEISKILEEQKKNHVPVYLQTPAPRLPTEDCFDSDEDGFCDRKIEPVWAKTKTLQSTQKIMIAAGEALKNTFFSVQAQSADLQDIFEVIQERKLKRTSSAVWRKPPRFTKVPELEGHEELIEEEC